MDVLVSPRRGQILSIDVLASLVFFAVALLLVFFSWNDVQNDFERVESYDDLKGVADMAAHSLFYTEGSPGNWYRTSVVHEIGLKSATSFDSVKMDALSSMDISEIKRILGVRGPKYNMSLYWYNQGSTNFSEVATYGVGVENPEAKDIIVTQYIGEHENGSVVLLKLKVWRT